MGVVGLLFGVVVFEFDCLLCFVVYYFWWWYDVGVWFFCMGVNVIYGVYEWLYDVCWCVGGIFVCFVYEG